MTENSPDKGEHESLPVLSATEGILPEGMSMSQYNRAREIRRVHKAIGYRDRNALSKLIKKGWLVNLPVDRQLLARNCEVLGKPVDLLKAKAKKKKPRFLCSIDLSTSGKLLWS